MAEKLLFQLDFGSYEDTKNIEEWLKLYFGSYPAGTYLGYDTTPVINLERPGYQCIWENGIPRVGPVYPALPVPGFDVYNTPTIAPPPNPRRFPRGQNRSDAESTVLIPAELFGQLHSRPSAPVHLTYLLREYAKHVVFVTRKWRYDENDDAPRAKVIGSDVVGFLITEFRTAIKSRVNFKYELLDVKVAALAEQMYAAIDERARNPASTISVAQYVDRFEEGLTSTLEDLLVHGYDFSDMFRATISEFADYVMVRPYRMFDIEFDTIGILLRDNGDYRVKQYHDNLQAKRDAHKDKVGGE